MVKDREMYRTKNDNIKKYQFLRFRYIVFLIILAVVVTYASWSIGIPVPIICLVLMKITYRFNFINSLHIFTCDFNYPYFKKLLLVCAKNGNLSFYA